MQTGSILRVHSGKPLFLPRKKIGARMCCYAELRIRSRIFERLDPDPDFFCLVESNV